MLHIGNKISCNLWEAKKPKNRPIDERERFIKAKYVAKEFLADLPVSNSTIAEVKRSQLAEIVSPASQVKIMAILEQILYSPPMDLIQNSSKLTSRG